MSWFSRTFSIKDSRGRIVCRVKKDTRTLRVPYRGSTIDFTPLNGNSILEHIELVPSATAGVNAGSALLPRDLPALKFLEIRGKVENPEVLTNFVELRHLNAGVFYLPETLDFVQAFPKLESLEVVANLFETLRPLEHLPRLKSLVLSSGFKFDLEPLAGCKNLRKLSVNSHVPGSKYLRELPLIEDLALVDFKLKNLVNIRHMTALKRLSLAGSSITEFDGLQEFKQLEHLNLRQTRIDNDNLQLVSDLARLKSLFLMYVDTVTDLAPLAQCHAMEDLDLYEMKGPIATLAPLIPLERLRRLNVMNTPVADDAVAAVCAMNTLSELRISVENDRDKSRVAGALPGCEVHFGHVPDPGTYEDIGSIRVWLPVTAGGDYFISQDITELLGVEEQTQAERKVKGRLVQVDPGLLGELKFDSEGSAFVAHSKSKASMINLATIINSLHSPGHRKR